MVEVGIKPFLCEEIDKSVIGTEWEKWLRALKLYLVDGDIKDDIKQRNKLLHLGGIQLQEVAYSIPGAVIDSQEDKKVFDILIDKLSDYFSPRQNSTFERHKFRRIKPCDGENFNKFLLQIRHQAKRCDFGSTKKEAEDINLKDNIIDNWANPELKKKILEKERTLDEVIELCQIFEQINNQSSVMNAYSNVATQSGSALSVSRIDFQNRERNGRKGSCQRCGRFDHINIQSCPAKELKCRKCGFQGHFAKCCKTNYNKRKLFTQKGEEPETKHFKTKNRSNVRFIDTDDSNSAAGNSLRNFDCFKINSGESYNVNSASDDMIECFIGNTAIVFLIDSGSKVNIVTDKDYNVLLKNNATIWDVTIQPTEVLKPYASAKPLDVEIRFVATVSLLNKKEVIAPFYVVNKGDVSIIGKITAKQLGILKLGLDINRIEIKTVTPFPKIKDFVVKLTIDPNVKPVQQSMRRVPIAVEPIVEKKLDEALKRGIIEKVTEPSAWISPIVIAYKSSGDIRICIDMRRANVAILRENYPIPTFDSFMTKLRNANYFSRLDLKDAYHQLELHTDSRPITTFITHKGLHRYLRLMFGITSAPEIFQKIMEQILAPCQNSLNFLDDIIVFGTDEQEHDECLKIVLQILKENDVTLNEEKCCFKVRELNFLGHKLSDKGIDVDSKKVNEIMSFRSPVNKEELRSFLGLVTYVGKFIPDLGTTTDFLRKLTKVDCKFDWTEEHEQHFNTLKRSLSSVPTLAYFDPVKRTRLVADASPVALGAVLLQFDDQSNPRVISFASKSLSDVERRYSQTEKESLALVWAVERFYYYLAGLEFELETDHKPLEAIFKPSSKPPARIERWLLRLQSFKFKVIYKPGKFNIADPLSRLCKVEKENSFDAGSESNIFRIVEQSTPQALKISEIIEESKKDQNIQYAIEKINGESWTATDKNIYYVYRLELSVFGSMLLRGNRIVVPETLTQQVLKLAHEGHPGESVMKRRLRAKVWWPMIDRQVEQFVKRCRDCMLVSQPNKSTLMVRHRFPDGPWQCLAMDLMGPLRNKQMVFVVIDYYSRYQEIKFLTSTTSAVIIKHLLEMFSRLGFPKSIRADNGPQFASEEFKSFCDQNNIELIQTTPYWPQANGEVENMNKSILKRLKIADSKGHDYQTEVQNFLLMYNVTPHGTTGKSPSELLFGRNIRDKIPSIKDVAIDHEDEEARDNDMVQKQKGKEREDASRKSRDSDICPGDKVLVKNMVTPHKLCTRFDGGEYDVIERKGNEVSVMRDGKVYKRQVSHLKKIIGKIPGNVMNGDQPVDPSTSSSQSSMPLLATREMSEEVPYQTSMQPVRELIHAGENSSSFSTPSTPKVSIHSTPGTSTPSTPRIPAMKNLLSSFSPAKVTPLKLEKKEGLWRPVERR